MAALQIFITVILALATTKDGVLSCSLPSHKSGSLPCATSDSDSTSIPHHASVSCGSSLGKPRDTLNKNPGNSPDSTSIPHHKSGSRPHTIPPVSLCNSPSGSSPCSSKVLPSLPKGSILLKPLFIPAAPLPSPTSVFPSTPFVPYGYNPALWNILMKLCLSSSACNNSSKPQMPSESQSVSPTSNSTQVPVREPNPHVISSSCTSIPDTNSGSSNGSQSITCRPTSISTVVPALQSPITVSPSISDVNSDFKKLLFKLSSLVPVPPSLPACKPTPLQPVCPPMRPLLNKDSVLSPVSKLHTPHLSFPPLGSNPCLPSIPPGLPCVSFLPSKSTNPTSNSESIQSKTPKGVSDHVPDEFPVSVAGPVQRPALESTLPAVPTLPTLPSTGHNPATIHNLLNLLLEPKLNITSVSVPNHKPHGQFPPCATPPGSNSCLSRGESKMPNDLYLPINLTSVKHPLFPFPFPSVPTLSPGISSGYNPAYMNHLIKYLLSTSNSIPSLSTSIPISQPLGNTSLVSPTSQNSSLISNNSNEQSFDLKPSVSLSNNSSDSLLASTISPNISTTQNVPSLPNTPNITSLPNIPSIPNIPSTPNIPSIPNISTTSNISRVPNITVDNNNYNPNNNPILTQILCKLLLSSLIASKTPLHPCLPPSYTLNINSASSIVPNQLPSSLPFQSTFKSLPDLLSIFPNLLPGPNLSSSGVPSLPVTPLPIPKLVEPIQSTIPDALTLSPLSRLSPLSPSLGCHHKHLRPHQTGVNPCLHKTIRPHTPSPLLPCSLSLSKLNSGCKFRS